MPRLIAWIFLLSQVFIGASPALWGGPSIESMEDRLGEEIAKLDAERDERIEALRQQYLGAVERQLEGALPPENRRLLQEERDRVRGQDRLHPGIPSSHSALARLHEVLIEQIEIAEAPRHERLSTLVENLQNFSDQQARTLRRQGQGAQADKWEDWARRLPARYLLGVARAGGPSRFQILLEAGEEPYLIIVGTSTSEHVGGAVNAPWRQCATGNRTNWPPVLAAALQEIGPVRIGGSTCAGVSSKEFIERGMFDWVVAQKPDAVIIEFAAGVDSADRFNLSVADSRRLHEEMVQKLRQANPEVEIFLWNGVRSTNQGRRDYWDRRSGREREVSDETQPEYAQMYIDLARELGTGVFYIDTYSIFKELYEKDSHAYRTFMRDGNHTNQRGAQEVIVPRILEVLAQGNS